MRSDEANNARPWDKTSSIRLGSSGAYPTGEPFSSLIFGFASQAVGQRAPVIIVMLMRLALVFADFVDGNDIGGGPGFAVASASI